MVVNRTSKHPPSMPAQKPLRPPGSKLGDLLWRIEMWIWTAFPFSVLEPWEVILLLTILSILSVLVLTGLFKYLPQQLVFMQRRAGYYLWGHETDETFSFKQYKEL